MLTSLAAVGVAQIFTGWVITILFACGVCSLLVALGVNSPSRYQSDQINYMQNVRSRTRQPRPIRLRPLSGWFSALPTYQNFLRNVAAHCIS